MSHSRTTVVSSAQERLQDSTLDSLMKSSVHTATITSPDGRNAAQAISACRRRRFGFENRFETERCREWAAQYANSLVMYEMYHILLPSEQDSDRVNRVPHEITAPSIRGLAHCSPWWSLAYAEYALSQWSLDDALDRIIRAVNLRAPLSCQQFFTLCHEYESIQHLPDAWVMDILGVEPVPHTLDALKTSVLPGDVVAMPMDSLGFTIISGVYHDDNGLHTFDSTMPHQLPDPIHSWRDHAYRVVKLTQEQRDRLYQEMCHVS